ncbi:hypothetical protein LCGC14_2764330 [marine sediment metagenome]|uniref:Uncharacterized protein n=1 Tax=marine sediment metagenome TaxID=412755 RepID=A0A0F8YY19_9ZZZZ
MAKDHPLLFTGDMVIRILTCAKCGKISVEFPCCHCGSEEFCKTQTRRVPVERYRNWKVGELIYVRENWWAVEVTDIGIQYCVFDDKIIDGIPTPKELRLLDRQDWKWGRHPNIHMPKKAARIWLKITGLREERVQEISLEDVIKEGIKDNVKCVYRDNVSKCDHHETVNKFISLWDSINAKRHKGTYAWAKNPITKVIESKRLRECPCK